MGLAALFLGALPGEQAQSREPDRTLKLFFAHTGEHGAFTYKRNGRYDRSELNRLSEFLRDWRADKTIKMDPHLLDVVWSIYKKSGSKDEIHVVSAYRSPETNEMLRRRSSGVAKNSQHRLGKAMDWFVKDVPLAKLRAIAMKTQGGGVGYYPRSGTPFIHTDTGSVRAWPRMSREQLAALFPNGNTLHIPSDGKPLPGYAKALAARKAAPETTLAYLDAGSDGGDAATRTWLSRVFPGDGSNEEDAPDGAPDDAAAPATAEAAPAPAPEVQVASLEPELPDARLPRARPGAASGSATAEAAAQAAAGLQPSRSAAAGTADTDTGTALAYAALPAARPDTLFLEASLNGWQGADISRGTGAQPIERAAQPKPPTPAIVASATESMPAGERVALAFAALDAAWMPTDRDRARLAVIAAAQTKRQQDIPEIRAPKIRVAAAAPAEEPDYNADADAMQRLIAPPQTPTAPTAGYDPRLAQIAMPVAKNSGAEVFRVPEAADGASSLGDTTSPPPVDRFAATEPADKPGKRGFFMRLFASLVE